MLFSSDKVWVVLSWHVYDLLLNQTRRIPVRRSSGLCALQEVDRKRHRRPVRIQLLQCWQELAAREEYSGAYRTCRGTILPALRPLVRKGFVTELRPFRHVHWLVNYSAHDKTAFIRATQYVISRIVESTMAEGDDAASTSHAPNGLHIVCPNGDSSSLSLDEPRGSKSSRSRSTRGRSVVLKLHSMTR